MPFNGKVLTTEQLVAPIFPKNNEKIKLSISNSSRSFKYDISKIKNFKKVVFWDFIDVEIPDTEKSKYFGMEDILKISGLYYYNNSKNFSFSLSSPK